VFAALGAAYAQVIVEHAATQDVASQSESMTMRVAARFFVAATTLR
jgi:hypothetical protein